ncbi:MAG: GIY-YIG nuclease family protein [Candidatus Magasanikbacteria bacterium]
MYFIYVISSLVKNYIYVGISDNPERRIEQHNKGYNRTTKPYTPFKVLLIEEYPTRDEARKREKVLKSGFGKEFLKNIK